MSRPARSARPGAARTASGSAKDPARYRLHGRAREIEVSTLPFLIGRATDCHLQLGSGVVSRHHARLDVTEEGLTIEDLGSRNGVVVNERKIKAATLLAHADIIGIGLDSFELVDEYLLRQPAHLSTIPPPTVGPHVVPAGEADVDVGDQLTVTADLVALTEREREVLELIVVGHTQREMAERLHLSVKTVESHRAKIAEKLGCKTRAELVTYAISAGLLGGLLRGNDGAGGKGRGKP